MGFEPTKLYATGLESVPFDRTWVHWYTVLPYVNLVFGYLLSSPTSFTVVYYYGSPSHAPDRDRTYDLAINSRTL